MTFCWRHPKYYKELRKLRATSSKQQAACNQDLPDQQQATSRTVASSNKQRQRKPQAASKASSTVGHEAASSELKS